MKRIVAATALSFCAVFVGAGAAHAYGSYEEPASAESNKASYWGDNCTKVEYRDGVKSVYAPGDYDFVVVKAGRFNTVYENFGPGAVSAISGKDISHIIYCESEYNS